MLRRVREQRAVLLKHRGLISKPLRQIASSGKLPASSPIASFFRLASNQGTERMGDVITAAPSTKFLLFLHNYNNLGAKGKGSALQCVLGNFQIERGRTFADAAREIIM